MRATRPHGIGAFTLRWVFPAALVFLGACASSSEEPMPQIPSASALGDNEESEDGRWSDAWFYAYCGGNERCDDGVDEPIDAFVVQMTPDYYDDLRGFSASGNVSLAFTFNRGSQWYEEQDWNGDLTEVFNPPPPEQLDARVGIPLGSMQYDDALLYYSVLSRDVICNALRKDGSRETVLIYEVRIAGSPVSLVAQPGFASIIETPWMSCPAI